MEPASKPIDLTLFAQQFATALADRTPCLLATADAEGRPDIGLKGSMMVWDKDNLAYLERTHRVHLNNLRKNPHVAVMYYNRNAEYPQVRLFGDVELLESGALRDEIRSKVIPDELSKDPDNKGVIVLIRVDKVITPRATFVRS